jgi:hypothetical protein
MSWLLLSGLALAAPQEGTRRFAVIVGANEGDHNDGPLRFAERDAERVAEVLEQLGSVYAEDIILLRRPTPDRLRSVFDEVGRRAAASEDAMVFFYYSGHADADALHLGRYYLPFPELRQAIEDVPAELKVMVVDACRSGELTRVKGAVHAETFQIAARDHLESKGMAIITSSSAGEDAQESDRLRGGVFTHHFVAGLLGAADSSGDRKVSLTEAYRYGYAHTIRTTSKATFIQHPTYSFEMAGKDDLVLTRLDREEDAGFLVLEEGGEYLIFESNAQGDLVSEFTVPSSGRISLSPGRYLVRFREADSVREQSLSLVSGETQHVSLTDMEVQPYGMTARKGMASQRRYAAGIAFGVVGEGQPLFELGPGGGGWIGGRVDFAQATLIPRMRYTLHRSENQDLALTHHQVGLDLSLYKLFDVGRVALGGGVRLGGDLALQRFDTAGVADPRQSVLGRGGPILRADWSVRPRVTIGLEGGVDTLLYSSELNRGLATRAVPWVGLDLTAYTF